MKILYSIILGFMVFLLFRRRKELDYKEYNNNLEELKGKSYEEIVKLIGKPYWYGTMDFGMAHGKWKINEKKVELFFRDNIVESIEILS